MKLMHVTIRTDKFEEEVNFYKEVAGLQITRDMRPMGRDIVFLANNEHATEIEIIKDEEAKDAGNDNISIGFKSDDLVRKMEELEEKGIRTSGLIKPSPMVKFFFVTDPAGVKVQFM